MKRKDAAESMIREMVSDMVDQPPLITETDITPTVAQRVYCAEDSPLRLGDGTPLHLEWVIEGRNGELYRVPSDLGGWLRRTPYHGELDGMKLVTSEKAETIVWLTYADTDGDDLTHVWRRDSHTDYGEPLGPSDYPLGQWAY